MSHLVTDPFRADTDNIDILNAIRNIASNDYQRRIPEATKANLTETNKLLLNNPPLRNEFVSALLNRIGLMIFRDNNWSNPFAKFKRGMLEYGDTIEEVQVGLAEAYTYDTDRDYLEKMIFGQERPDVQSSFHKINRTDFYKITINDAILKRAFVEGGGLADFITQLMAVPSTSDQYDEFLLMTQLFREYSDNGGFFRVQAPNVGISTSGPAESKQLLRQIREFSNKLPFISSFYNAAGMPISAQKEDLELFLTPEVDAAMDVEALAAAFNINYAEVESRKTIVPQERFNIPGAQAILTTKDFFVVADSLFEMRQAQNPVGLYDNFFLHHHQVLSTSRFVPALLFTTEAPYDVIEIPETPVTSVSPLVFTDSEGAVATELTRGELYQVSGSAVTTPAGGFNDAVYLELQSNSVTGISPLTYLTNTGTLHVGPDEPSTTLAVKAIATDDHAISTTSSAIPVTGDKLVLWPNPRVLEDDDTDGLFEVIPETVGPAPTSGANKNKVTIPTPDEGYEYRDGATVVDGDTITLTANKTIIAFAKTGYELKSGVVASWNLIFTP